MGEPRIIVGEGYSKEKIRMVMSLIGAQLDEAVRKSAHKALPAIKRQDRVPFNKSKEIERRRKQIEKSKGH